MSHDRHERVIATLIRRLDGGRGNWLDIAVAKKLYYGCADCARAYDWLGPLAGASEPDAISEARISLAHWQRLKDPAERAKDDADFREWWEREGQYQQNSEAPYGTDITEGDGQ